MPFTAHPGAYYNVVGSFNNFFATQITGAGLPAFMPSAVTNYDYPNQPLTFPSFSVTHLGGEPTPIAQGQHLDPGWKGYRRDALAQIDCWASYSASSGQGPRNLRIMRDMAARIFATGAAFPILDVYGSTAAPTGTGALVRCGAVQDAPAPPDPNPDVLRHRMLVAYNWIERVTAG